MRKESLSSNADIVITDILGFEQRIPSDEVIEIIKPAIERLAKSISDEIIGSIMENHRKPL